MRRGGHYKSNTDTNNDDSTDHDNDYDGDHQVHKNLSHELKAVSLYYIFYLVLVF